MKIRISKSDNRRKTAAMSLVEMVIASGIGSVVLGSAGVVFIYSLFSFAGLGNYAILTGQSKLSLDYISREMREATKKLAALTPRKSSTCQEARSPRSAWSGTVVATAMGTTKVTITRSQMG